VHYFIAAVAQYLSPSMMALDKYFIRLQWFKTKEYLLNLWTAISLMLLLYEYLKKIL